MNKEELIKRAAERGITLDETQAEKYINLSDEELENLEVSGGCETGPRKQVHRDQALKCQYFVKSAGTVGKACDYCIFGIPIDLGSSIEYTSCKNQAAWENF